MCLLTALKRCALGLDLYLWLTYRTFALRAPLRLSDSTAERVDLPTGFLRIAIADLENNPFGCLGMGHEIAVSHLLREDLSVFGAA